LGGLFQAFPVILICPSQIITRTLARFVLTDSYRGIALSGLNANATEHYSAWWRCAFGEAVTETSPNIETVKSATFPLHPLGKVRPHIL
jgi:hypothetical protein